MSLLERALRREQVRDRLAELQAGGSPRWAIAVRSAAVIDGKATRHPCPHCGHEHRVLEHTRPAPGLRRVDVQCRHCSTLRTLWFRLIDDDAN